MKYYGQPSINGEVQEFSVPAGTHLYETPYGSFQFKAKDGSIHEIYTSREMAIKASIRDLKRTNALIVKVIKLLSKKVD